VKNQWKTLWREKFEDRLLAESVAIKDYPLVFVDKGTVVSTSKGRCIEGAEEVIRRHEVDLGERFLLPPNPSEGGYGAFIREIIMKQPRWRRRKTDDNTASKPGRSRT